jgi:hypothetical protein
MAKTRFKRLSIATDGKVTSVIQTAKNLSEAIEQELRYYDVMNKIPAKINFEEEEDE